MQPKVSIIMPSLNVRQYIRECIESTINQTLKEIEIICVDAGSTDGTLEILEGYASKDSRIRVIYSNKKSYGYQMNLGLNASKGEYIGIVETDDFVPLNMYAELYNVAKKNNADFVKADFYRFTVNKDGSLNKEYNQLTKGRKGYYNKILNGKENPEIFQFIMNIWSGIYKIDFLRKYNVKFNETAGASYQDNGFWFQTICQAKRVLFVNRPYYMNRRDNPNSSVFSVDKAYCVCEEYDFIRNWLSENPRLEGMYAPYCAKYRFSNYDWKLNTINPENRLEYLHKIQKDFMKIKKNGELLQDLFPKNQWDKLMRILRDPDLYYLETYRKDIFQGKSDASKNEITRIYSSWSYRIGRVITWGPRKLRGCVRCYQEHGIKYTINRIFVHLFS